MKLKMSATDAFKNLNKYDNFSVSNGGWITLFKKGEHNATAILSVRGILIERVEDGNNNEPS